MYRWGIWKGRGRYHRCLIEKKELGEVERIVFQNIKSVKFLWYCIKKTGCSDLSNYLLNILLLIFY